jgi:undecaprenyl-diphosphatase
MKTNLKLITTSILLCLFSNTILAQAQWETDYLRKLEDRRSQGKNDFYNSVSTSFYLFSIAAPLTYLTTGIIKKDKTIRKQGLYLVESIGGATFISYATKNIVKRERPAIQDTTLNPVNEALNYSFPSGHTSAAFSLATSLTM